MAMYLEIITPDKNIYKGEVDYVNLPGADGSFGVLKDHAPIISTLKEGEIVFFKTEGGDYEFDSESGEIKHATGNDKELSFTVKGGVVEVKDNKISVLAE
jgi:F-type H+-transporting ATPase subunit epsilon